jgi:hypothetical protein
MLMSLGMFGFELPTLAYQELSKKTEWRHASSDRFGARPASQYLGPGADAVTLSGVLLPGISGSFAALATLKEMGDQGEAQPLVDGTGRVHGAFVILSIDERQSFFTQDGVPRKTDFTIELRRAG